MHAWKEVKEHGDRSFHAAVHLRECAEVTENNDEKERTSRDLPNTLLVDCELVLMHTYLHSTRLYVEDHVHVP